MKTSPKGIATLEVEEGVVLKAYRCPAGHLTIGAGITNAAGVIKITPTTVITRAQASELMAKALESKYEPSVEVTMAKTSAAKVYRPAQHEFDAGVLFHWNTGAITRASWVKRWKEGAAPSAVRAALALWNKGGGKVLPGLVKRREREADILLLAKYPVEIREAVAEGWAAWSLKLTSAEKAEARAALAKLGYAVGDRAGHVALDAAKAFQRDHDLTVDGIIGRATLSTLQRRIDAAKKGESAAAVSTSGVAGGSAEIASGTFADQMPWLGPVLIAAAIAWALWVAWQYRDALAAKVQSRLPRFAAYLRSF